MEIPPERVFFLFTSNEIKIKMSHGGHEQHFFIKMTNITMLNLYVIYSSGFDKGKKQNTEYSMGAKLSP